MENGPTSRIINYDKVGCLLPTFVIENGPEEFNRLKDIILEKRSQDPEYLDTDETAGHSVKAWLTKWDTHQTDDRFVDIGNYVIYVLDYITQQVFNTYAKYKLSNLWAVVMEKGDQATSHNHFPSAWSCVYYIDVEDDVAPIFLEDKEVNVKNGMLVLFPGFLEHYVPPTTGRRIAVAMNISVVDES